MGEWKNRFRRGMVMALTCAVAGGGTASAVSSMPRGEIPGSEEVLVGVSLEDMEDAVQGESAVSQVRSEAVAYDADGKGLKSSDAAIYNALKLSIEEIARGEETSTQIALKTRMSSSKLAQVDVNTIVTYLLNDCPFDLYWHDKTKTMENGKETDGVYCKYFDDGTIVFSFKVSAPYRVSDGELYKMNSAYKGTVDTARQKAQSIVDTNRDCTDYDKLLNYRNAICDLVTYDYAAQGGALYGNSYQVINVFDDDMYSNVVCEGYAKAFQYLCDLTDFDNDLECYTVTGVTDAGNGAGEHMWNIVRVGGDESYLVDVTNCDAGTIGEGTALFMTDELAGSVDSGYTYNNGWSSITYQYGGESREVYGAQILSLANDDNSGEALLHVKGDNSGTQDPVQEDSDGIMRVDVPEDEEDEKTPEQSREKETEKKEETDDKEESDSGFKFGVPELEKVYGDDSFTETVLGYEGSNKVKYTSSDTTVAAVTKRGKVTIQGAGTAVITAESTSGDKASYTLKVSPKKLEWDTSDLHAVDRADRINGREATLYGEIKLEGILPHDKDRDSQFSFDSKYLTGTYSEIVPGRQTVTLNWKEGKEVRLARSEKAGNYEMPESLPELTGRITSITRLADPQIETSEPEDGLKYKLEMEDGISGVPDTLMKDRDLNTPPKIEAALQEDLVQEGIPKENVVVYDVALYWQDRASVPAETEEGLSGEDADVEDVSEENASEWVKVTDETFPEGGLTITLPYPGGMPRNVKDIVISHMFVEDMYTSSPGEIEHPADIEETVDGIKFTVNGLSPIAIGWSAETTDTTPPIQNAGDDKTPTGDSGQQGTQGGQNGQNGQNDRNTNNQTNTNVSRSPVTGDTMQILIYVVLAVLCGLTIKGIQAVRRTGKKR